METDKDLESKSIEELQKMKNDLYDYSKRFHPTEKYDNAEAENLLRASALEKLKFSEVKEKGKIYGIFVVKKEILNGWEDSTFIYEFVVGKLIDIETIEINRGFLKTPTVYKKLNFQHIGYSVKDDKLIEVNHFKKCELYKYNPDYNSIYHLDPLKLKIYNKALDDKLNEYLKEEVQKAHNLKIVNWKAQEIIEVIERKKTEASSISDVEAKRLELKYGNNK